MATLSRELRRALENVVSEARDVGEEAAGKALKALAVSDREPHRSMSVEQKALRNRLRAHGRQLGDSRHAERGTQEIDHLVAECAYEHWHRMLFARFLAENQLLLEPESGVAIAIEEVRELGRARGKDWVTLAGEFAMRMLPYVFRQDDPVLEVRLAPEDRKRLEELLESVPIDVYTASDSLGWTYQFWQTERKNAINAAGNKIGPDELPAVTQLFTEDYMVDFLLDNTLGAWHASRVLSKNRQLAENAKNEEEVREAVSLPGCNWQYLRFIRGENGSWTPGAGTFDGWPKEVKDLKCLDPCMGSGHFVVALFERLVELRVAAENLDEDTAISAVISDNLFGLEIDPRCTQIAAFNLALAAWRRVGHRQLPAMNLACSGLAPNAKKQDWVKLAGDNERLQRGMAQLYSIFDEAPILGSLIDPRVAKGDLLAPDFSELQPLLESALAAETTDDGLHEIAVTARGVVRAAEILSDKFTLVATNVPYLGIRQQSNALIRYCAEFFTDARHDLATCFVDRGFHFLAASATQAVVVPQSWLFSSSYEKFRLRLLKTQTWNFVAPLGSGAFETISGEVVNVALFACSKSEPASQHQLMAVPVEGVPGRQKAAALSAIAVEQYCQLQQLNNPDGRVVLHVGEVSGLISDCAKSLAGIQNGDSPRFLRLYWEVGGFRSRWAFMQSAVDHSEMIGGLDTVIDYDLTNGHLRAEASWRRDALHDSDQRGKPFWGKYGIIVSRMGKLPCARYFGTLYDQGSAVIVPDDGANLAPLYAYISSPEYSTAVRRIDKKLNVTSATLAKVPFSLEFWQRVAADRYPNGLPKPYSSDPTQWLFNGHAKDSDRPLQVATARLLSYKWPRQTGSGFPDCPALGPDGLERFADSDGIMCLSATKGEASADERLREVLARAYGNEWDAAVLEQLLTQVGFSGRTLTDWLRDGFFEQHCALFHQRPFIWHIWDGERDGFHALVNYHKLTAPDSEGRKTLEKLTYSYLGDWITRQKAEQKQGKEGADAKLAAALHFQEELKKILEGEPPHDLFVRWKPLHEQAIGWEPDINDGVRINIRPFMTAETLKGKSIFRKAPKIKWDKDRGKEPNRSKRDFPWFWSWDEETADFKGGPAFDGNRWNDLHYGNEMKEAALAGAEKKR